MNLISDIVMFPPETDGLMLENHVDKFRKRMWIPALCILFASVCLLMTGCGEKRSDKQKKISGLMDLNRSDCIIGGELGTLSFTTAKQKLPNAAFSSYNLCLDVYPALVAGKIDAMVYDRPAMEYAALNYPEFIILPDNLASGKISIGAPLNKTELMKKVNSFIVQYKQDGTYRDMYERWMRTKQSVMPEIPEAKNPEGTLRIGVTGSNQPMSFIVDGGKLAGFDIEFSQRLALALNMKCQMIYMDYNALFVACASGKIDLAVANMDATEERRKSMLFSDYYIESPISVMIRKKDYASTVKPEDKALASAGNEIHSLADLKGKKAASMTGSAFQPLTDPLQSGIQHVLFNENHTCVAALRAGKVDAVLIDKPMAQMFASRFSEDTRFVCVYAKDYYGFAFRKGSPLTERASKIIRELKKTGEMEKMSEKWLSGKESELSVWTHKNDFDGSDGVLHYASDPTQEPMCYLDKSGNPCGLDIEIMRRVAYELNMKFHFISMNFGSLIEALLSGKADAVGGSMSITDERKKRVDFSECYYEGGLSILAGKQGRQNVGITDLSQLAGKRIGIVSGTTLDAMVRHHLPQSEPMYFNTFTDLPLALNSGKIDAFLMELPQFAPLQKQYPKMTALPQMLSHDEYAFVFAKKNRTLCDEFSRQIRNMKSDGTLKKLDALWFSGNDSAPAVSIPPIPSPKGTLRFAVIPQMEPFAFMREGKPVGYDLDVARIAAARIGYLAVPVSMDFSAFLESVETGKVDFGASCITVTEERKKKMLFSESNYRCGIVAVVLSATPEAPENVSFLNSLKESFNRTFLVENRWKLILDGLKITVIITVFAAIFGTLLAFPVCFLRRSKRRIPKWIGGLYVSLLQGTPILVILMLLYYVAFAQYNIDAVIVAVIGFGLNFAAYAGEMLRTGIDAVPTGQIEAAKALSLTRFQTFRKVVFPQAARQILPVYRGEFINMLKTTSIVGYIAIQDLTKMSDIIRSRTYEAFFPLIATAVIYFAAAWLLTAVLSYFEYLLTPGRCVRATKGEASK